MSAVNELTTHDEPGGNAGPKIEIDALLDADQGPPEEFGERGCLDVISHRHHKISESLGERRGNREAAPAGNVWGKLDVVGASKAHR